jgi:pimeloyl-ACP methyl ester carboxylesterase
MSDTWDRLRLDVNGTPTVVLVAGDPDSAPLVFLHGGGTFHGWDFAIPWAERYRVLIPFLPGWGESGDLPDLSDVGDLVLHTTALLDELELTADVNLAGISLGGRLAARIAIGQQHRLRRLVLVAPSGLRVPGHDGPDIFSLTPEQVVGHLAHDPATIAPHLPSDPGDVDFAVDRYRETRSLALIMWDHPMDRVIPRWLPTVRVPTLIVWGEEDQMIPVGQARAWADLSPGAEVRTFPAAGHLVLDESADAVAAVADFCG